MDRSTIFMRCGIKRDEWFEVLKQIRAKHTIPVIMLTAKGDDTDRIVGLELGADDYLPKPFNPRELLARIRAILRRAQKPEVLAGSLTGSRVWFADWTLETDTRR